MSVTSAARRFTKEVIRFSDSDSLTVSESHRLFFCATSLERGLQAEFNCGLCDKSKSLDSSHAPMSRKDRATRLRFCNMIHGHPWFGTSALAGYFYET